MPQWNANSASSSDDLAQARALSRALQGAATAEPHAAPATHAVPAPLYARFAPARAAPPSVSGAGFGPGTWNTFLDHCIAVSGAVGAFLTDAQGLMVACRGALGVDDAEVLGARLSVALVPARALDPLGVRLLSVELADRTVHAIPLGLADSALILCVVTAAPLDGWSRGALLAALGHG